MADETTVIVADTSEETAKTNATESGKTETSAVQNEGAVSKTFTQAELDEIIERRLAKEREKADKKAADARAEAERKAAEEQGKYQELYEREKAERERLAAEKAQVERERLIDRIASKHNLPEKLRDRLRGETEEDLEADAQALAEFAQQKVTAPNVDSQARGTSNAIATEEEVADIARRMGLKLPNQPQTANAR